MRDDHIEEGIGNLKSLVADGRKVDSIAILLQFIKVSDDVVSLFSGSAAKFAPLREHGLEILEPLPHLVGSVSITPHDIHQLGLCDFPG